MRYFRLACETPRAVADRPVLWRVRHNQSEFWEASGLCHLLTSARSTRAATDKRLSEPCAKASTHRNRQRASGAGGWSPRSPVPGGENPGLLSPKPWYERVRRRTKNCSSVDIQRPCYLLTAFKRGLRDGPTKASSFTCLFYPVHHLLEIFLNVKPHTRKKSILSTDVLISIEIFSWTLYFYW